MVPGGCVSKTVYDIAIIGGGVNGCGIARDAAGRGLSVYLAEKDDLASGTSSASTKLIHGGLRYLEHYEFKLVRESLREREVLWAMAPHIIHPLRFVLPHAKGLRPVWLIRLGLFLYDHLGGRDRLPGSHFVDLSVDAAGSPLHSSFTRGFEYSDCWVDDSRLVVLNARDAADKGAEIHTRCEVSAATRHGNEWRLEVQDTQSKASSSIRARVLVNATGPWIGDVIADRIAAPSKAGIRLVKGSHIVVPRMFDHDRAYIFQNPDQRIVFAIPYQQDYTLIGTTDLDYSGHPEDARAEASEVSYLCAAISEYFSKPVEPDDVVWSYSGIRPLYADGASAAQEATRDYVLDLDGSADKAVVINVFGGKITTYRNLAEAVLGKLKPWFPTMRTPWTRGAVLPGGDFPIDGGKELLKKLTEKYPQMDHKLIERLALTYGTLSTQVLGGAESQSDLGHHFGAGLYQREIEYLIEFEWARTMEDILWRRTKLGLRMSDEEITGLSSWLMEKSSQA
ncbi:MAG: glycerol-3-phosphate dehydrogenase [Rhodospirillales bacterium]|nr:glycerol-3-phosphate dehydrogenase [Rhodospirillales bacterium]